MPLDRAVFEYVSSIIFQPKSAWNILFGGVWRKPMEFLREEGKACVMELRHACRSSVSVCRWIADEPSRSKWYHSDMHNDVEQCGTSAAWAAADSELTSSLQKPQEWPVRKRLLESLLFSAPALVCTRAPHPEAGRTSSLTPQMHERTLGKIRTRKEA